MEFEQLVTKLSNWSLPTLLGLAIYFLLRFVKIVDSTLEKLEEKSEDTLIKVTVLSERVSNIDDKLQNIEKKMTVIDKLENKVLKSKKKKKVA